ncbi:uncharacterized protein CLUP02_17470 [Colletotrichum lupini]|uniref:Uncharacterized protein n=1 Tax=Colletotrichum lupini TaxID=145971 RepID=A0A9Q8SEK9_9PEZI|nr:uncharacterized protein CLUP02_17470 [Colletotrichum lupini]UQC75961.1 hypothetical protein CLUP02_17470 [Colletotrichum lupini]
MAVTAPVGQSSEGMARGVLLILWGAEFLELEDATQASLLRLWGSRGVVIQFWKATEENRESTHDKGPAAQASHDDARPRMQPICQVEFLKLVLALHGSFGNSWVCLPAGCCRDDHKGYWEKKEATDIDPDDVGEEAADTVVDAEAREADAGTCTSCMCSVLQSMPVWYGHGYWGFLIRRLGSMYPFSPLPFVVLIAKHAWLHQRQLVVERTGPGAYPVAVLRRCVNVDVGIMKFRGVCARMREHLQPQAQEASIGFGSCLQFSHSGLQKQQVKQQAEAGRGGRILPDALSVVAHWQRVPGEKLWILDAPFTHSITATFVHFHLILGTRKGKPSLPRCEREPRHFATLHLYSPQWRAAFPFLDPQLRTLHTYGILPCVCSCSVVGKEVG